MLGMIKSVAAHIPNITKADITDQKTWIAGLSGLSMTAVARKLLDAAFWANFLQLLKTVSGNATNQEDLLITAQNMGLDSTALADHGKEISGALVELCGARCKRAPMLLNKVLEKCPNTLLAEDKVQYKYL